MHDAPKPGHPLRSVLAIVAGLITVVLTSTGADAICHGTGFFPPPGTPMPAWLWLIATVYRTAFTVLGAWITARLAPGHPMKHAIVLGWIGVALATVGTVGTWSMGPEFGPKWYPISLIVTALPACWAGGRLVPARSLAN